MNKTIKSRITEGLVGILAASAIGAAVIAGCGGPGNLYPLTSPEYVDSTQKESISQEVVVEHPSGTVEYSDFDGEPGYDIITINQGQNTTTYMKKGTLSRDPSAALSQNETLYVVTPEFFEDHAAAQLNPLDGRVEYIVGSYSGQ